MTAILQIISGPTWQHLAWALLHTLWQGAIVAALLWLTLRRVPVERPQTRYVLSLVAMLGIVLGGLVTWSFSIWIDPRLQSRHRVRLSVKPK